MNLSTLGNSGSKPSNRLRVFFSPLAFNFAFQTKFPKEMKACDTSCCSVCSEIKCRAVSVANMAPIPKSGEKQNSRPALIWLNTCCWSERFSHGACWTLVYRSRPFFNGLMPHPSVFCRKGLSFPGLAVRPGCTQFPGRISSGWCWGRQMLKLLRRMGEDVALLQEVPLPAEQPVGGGGKTGLLGSLIGARWARSWAWPRRRKSGNLGEG